MVIRKHTINGGTRFREAIALAAGRLEEFRQSEASRVGLLQTLEVDDQTAESLILRAWEAKIISHLQLPAVLKEWREPSHVAFGPRTRWSLFNAFTEILRPFSRSNPQAFAGRTFRLNRLLVPPNEGPAVIDATFRVDGRELLDLDDRREAEVGPVWSPASQWPSWLGSRSPGRTGRRWMNSGRTTSPVTDRPKGPRKARPTRSSACPALVHRDNGCRCFQTTL